MSNNLTDLDELYEKYKKNKAKVKFVQQVDNKLLYILISTFAVQLILIVWGISSFTSSVNSVQDNINMLSAEFKRHKKQSDQNHKDFIGEIYNLQTQIDELKKEKN